MGLWIGNNCLSEFELATNPRRDFHQLETCILWFWESGTKPSFTCWKLVKTPCLNSYSWIYCCTLELWPLSSVLLCWDITSCYLQLWYPVYYNELDHFWELSPHLFGTLGLHCSGPLLSVSFGALLLKKRACELITVDKSFWLHVNNCVPIRHRDTERLYSICNSSNSLSPNW